MSWRQKVLRPVKKWAVKFGLVSKKLEGKKIIKKLIFGRLVKITAEIKENMVPFIEPTELSSSQPNNKQKVIYCIAILQS